uniref:Uncharacterized protein n=1 Tax=Acanthochromis polyacanthus TaxID=80966 RepID=A0A3Q1HXC5_9TELE
MGIEHSPAVPFGFYTPRGTDSERAGGGSGGTTAAPHGTGYQDPGGGGHHTDGVLYLGSRGSLADTLPLHIAPRWFSAHSGETHARKHTHMDTHTHIYMHTHTHLVSLLIGPSAAGSHSVYSVSDQVLIIDLVYILIIVQVLISCSRGH